MTKLEFAQFYEIFEKVVKQDVGGVYCINASAELVDYCGGCTLVLRPDCILWGQEVLMLHALSEKFCHSLEIDLQRSVIKVW